MKRIVPIVLTLIVLLTACEITIPCSKSTPSQSPTPTESASPKPTFDARANKIDITSDIDAELRRVIFTVTNNSNTTFMGKISYIIKSGTSTVSVGYFSVEQLNPVKQSVSRVDVSTTDNLIIDASVSEAYFVELTDSLSDARDETASEALSTSFMENFYSASWYGYIDDISIFDSTQLRYVILTVNGGENTELSRLANTMFENYKDAYSFNLVIVENSSGEELCRQLLR